jgi:superfamily II DNA or RNA helicase
VQGVVARYGDDHLMIRFSDRHPPFLNAVKSIPGYRKGYQDRAPVWLVHVGQIRRVRMLADMHGWIVTASVKKIPDLAPEDFPITVTVEGDQVLLAGPTRDDVSEIMADVDGRFDPDSGVWRVPAEHAADTIMDLRRIAVLRFPDGDDNVVLRGVFRAEAMLRLSRQLEPSPGWQLTPRVRRDLHGFQHAGVEYLCRSRRCFAWATMGAGKTTVALAALEHLDAHGIATFPTVIVPPAGLKTNWVREIAACLPHRTTFVAEGKKARLPLDRPDVWIVNYDILGNPADASSWVATLQAAGYRSLVVDEGHRVINLSSIRGKAVAALSAALPPEATRFELTGTPVRNRRAEVHPQLQIIGRGNEFGTKIQLRKDERLSRRLRTVCQWRPTPAEVLKALGVVRDDGSIEAVDNFIVVDGDPEILAEYRAAEDNFIEWLRDKARAKAIELGQDPESAAVEAALKAGSAAGLMLVNTLCRLAGQAKQQAAREWVQDFATTGDKLLVFAENHDMMDAVCAITDPPLPRIDGHVKHADRTRLCDRFQDEADDPIQTMVLQIDAAGEGLTLTKAYQVLHTQFCWVPGQHDQANSRAQWRLNDPHNIVANYLVCAGTIDEDRKLVLDAKREEMRHVTEGDRETIASTSTYGEVFARLLKRALR